MSTTTTNQIFRAYMALDRAHKGTSAQVLAGLCEALPHLSPEVIEDQWEGPVSYLLMDLAEEMDCCGPYDEGDDE